jgi:hypothetical protein
MYTRQFRQLKKTFTAILFGFFLLLSLIGFSEQTDIHLSFVKLSDWKEKSFKGHTTYSHVQDEGKTVLQADAVKTASALYKKIEVNPAEIPIIKWSWKVKQALAAENPYRKDVDDFAGRVIVLFPGTFFWQYRAVVYVWADKLPIGTVVQSAFSKDIVLVVVESGNQYAGVWRNERRNYLEDYHNYFHASPPNTMAVAIMTDADNTKTEATAWYGDIFLSRDLAHLNKVKEVSR